MILAKEKYDYYDLEQISRPTKRIKKVRRLKFKNNPRFVAVVIVLSLFVMGLLLAGRYAQIASTGYQIVKLKKQLTTVQNESDQLEIQVEKLQALDRIEKVAVERLGMQKPATGDGVQLLAVDTNNDSDVAKKQVANAAQQNKAQNGQKNSFLQAVTNMIINWKGSAKAVANPIN